MDHNVRQHSHDWFPHLLVTGHCGGWRVWGSSGHHSAAVPRLHGFLRKITASPQAQVWKEREEPGNTEEQNLQCGPSQDIVVRKEEYEDCGSVQQNWQGLRCSAISSWNSHTARGELGVKLISICGQNFNENGLWKLSTFGLLFIVCWPWCAINYFLMFSYSLSELMVKPWTTNPRNESLDIHVQY